MSKNIVLLSDGTGNSAAKLFKTNVWRLYQGLDLTPASNQIAFYDDGVGTSALRPLAVLGGALGFGLKRNVKQLYMSLCQSYADGDRIYAFGFSRGAFTIRVLAGLIATQGVIPGRDMEPRRLRQRVATAYRRDRKDYLPSWRTWRRRNAASKTAVEPTIPAGHRRAEITFLGVWDTVDAYGLPVDEFKRGLDYWWLGLSFPDQDLSPIVNRACHALALDDKRRTFHPVLWNEDFEKKLLEQGKIPDERLKQVWFAGMHSNIGGGYAKEGLAYVSLNWMIEQAQAANRHFPLQFHQAALDEFARLANAHADMGNSRAGLAAYYRYDPRRLSVLCNDDYNKVCIETPKIHHSVFDRIAAQYVTYIPHMIPARYDVVGPKGDVVANTYETAPQAVARDSDLERAWDLVWWRRLVYFVTLLLASLLVVFPWIWEIGDPAACRGPLCFVEPALVAGGEFLPAFLEHWILAFRVHITPFFILAMALILVMWFGGWLERQIEGRATEAWSHLSGVRPASVGRWGPLSRIARRLRTSNRLVTAYRWIAREFLPFLFFVATVWGLVYALNRLAFDAAEAIGQTCKPTPPSDVWTWKDNTANVIATFETQNPCFATGITLTQGQTYRVEFNVKQQWIDGTHPTSPAGFTTSTGGWKFRLAVPMRRLWSGNWFEPIARIDNTGLDRYPLSPVSAAPLTPDPASQNQKEGLFQSKPFVAHTTGELFLFVNDAIVALPWYWSWFYDGNVADRKLDQSASGKNNQGTAEIAVRRLEPTGRQ